MSWRELKWIHTHRREIEKHSGKWIAIKYKKGILAVGDSPKKVIETARKKYAIKTPMVFKVPRKDEEELILNLLEVL